jgi:predicted XRE-type DNA-binding protein
MTVEHNVGETVERGSGNVFADLGLSVTKDDMLKVEFARAITAIINRGELTQIEAAEILRTDQAKVSAILRGQLKGFSVERLIRYAMLLGQDVDIRISRRRRAGRRPGRIKVHAA